MYEEIHYDISILSCNKIPSCFFEKWEKRNEPTHDKTYKWHVRPAKTQIMTSPSLVVIRFHHVFSTNEKKEISQPIIKPTKWHVCPAKTQINLGIRPVWSESLLSAWRKLGTLATQWAQRLIRRGRCPGWSEFAGCTCHFVGFVVRWLKWFGVGTISERMLW